MSDVFDEAAAAMANGNGRAPGALNIDDELRRRVERIRIDREARRIVDQEQWSETFKPPPFASSLTDELAITDDPVEWTVADLHPRGGNALLTAQFKAGKSTLVLNLAQSLADGDPFLGRHEVGTVSGRVAFWNYEVPRRQFREWCREVEIQNTDAVVALNLRGHAMPLWVPEGEAWCVQWLRMHDVSDWIVDPFGRAFRGAGAENSNDDVGLFVDALDRIKEQAGVDNLYLTSHTGRAQQAEGEEHVRGATVLDDWADVRWLYTMTGRDRFFRASGRDVDTGEDAEVRYDELTRRLTLGQATKRESRSLKMAESAVDALRRTDGLGTSELRAAMKGDKNHMDAGIRHAVEQGWIRVEQEGNKKAHYLADVPARPKVTIAGKEWP